MAGRFNVSNALCAVACVNQLGVDADTAFEALGRFPGVPGRVQQVSHHSNRAVFVDYAHTDDALGNVLRALRETTAGRLIVVFGCGGDRDRLKRPLMGRVASQLADLVVLTSDNPRSEEPQTIIDEICTGVADKERCICVPDRREAIAKALSLSDPADTVLIAGKGHECYQEFADRTVAFDDAAVAMELLDGMD
jgi:UDP-N-acetylmuramoyl-L-alanyl-D-glutamate--2,6-diaminopimelate ligase